MAQDGDRHQRVRFRRGEIADLSLLPSGGGLVDLAALPSASPPAVPQGTPARDGGLRRAVARGMAAAAATAGLLLGLFYLIGVSGLGTEQMRSTAERAVEVFTGTDVTASLGPTKLSLDGSRLLALEVQDVSLVAADGSALADAGRLSLGFRFMPLLSGDVRLGSAKLAEARIDMALLPRRGDGNWMQAITNADGLVDPRLVPDQVFAAVHRLFRALASGTTSQLELEDVELNMPIGSPVRLLRVHSASLSETSPGTLSIEAVAEADGRPLTISGTAIRQADTGIIESVDISARVSAAPGQAPERVRMGTADLRLTGAEGSGGTPSRLALSAAVDGLALDLGPKHGTVEGLAEISAALGSDSSAVALDRVRVASGDTLLDFAGSLRPAALEGAVPGYRFDLESPASRLATRDLPGQRLEVSAAARGSYDPGRRRLAAEAIEIRSAEGAVTGAMAFDLPAGKAPGVTLAVSLDSMPVWQAKHLWPWFASGGPRRWVYQHLFSGQVERAELRFQVPPGRLGNGVPLNADELAGSFTLSELNFDTTGEIPPVQDATGTVELRGQSSDISLGSGRFVLPDGRSVAARNGRLEIRNANRKPVIGKLVLDVSGDAGAVAAVANSRPINALSRLALTAADFSGQVNGRIAADVPMHGGIERSMLGWKADLSYEDLAIAKPFQGQKVTEAAGTLAADRDKVAIEARAQLNGVPATISMLEPISEAGPERQRTIELALDDDARKAIAPGLATLISGTTPLTVTWTPEGDQEFSADLTEARLNVPWAGWSKGPGIAAAATFLLERDGGTTRVAELEIAGKSFSASGEVTLAEDGLQSARFGSVRLNRGDAVSVTVSRSGKAYDVDVKGSAFDARALLKQITGAEPKPGGNAGGGSQVRLQATIGKVSGFNGTSLADLQLRYEAVGSKPGSLDATAFTGSGSGVSIRTAAKGGKQTVEVETDDAGELLRFLDLYARVQGGSLKLALSGEAGGPMSGKVDARDFWVVDEPRLSSIVSSPAPGSDRSLKQAVRADIDTSRVHFERGYAELSRDTGFLAIRNGVLRGPLIGATFQGTLYDPQGRMAMTGTFMPAYGLNRIFGEIPLLGAFLGNGRDRGLIGVTFKLEGNAKSPRLQINPLSVIAPGIFRSIFEFR